MNHIFTSEILDSSSDEGKEGSGKDQSKKQGSGKAGSGKAGAGQGWEVNISWPKSKASWIWTGVLLLIALGIGIIQVNVLNNLIIMLRTGWIYFTLITVSIVLFSVRHALISKTPTIKKVPTKPSVRVWSQVLLWVASSALVATAPLGFFHDFMVNRALASSIVVVDVPMVEYDRRPPFAVAANQASAHVTTQGDLQPSSYVPTLNHFSALVAERGLVRGYYEVVWHEIGDAGQSVANNCSFTAERRMSFGGWWGSNLERAVINEAGFGTIIEQDDAYGLCLDGRALVVIPLQRMAGGVFPHRVFAGVAVYDGATGEIEILRDIAPGDLPGPVYPLSLAERQRNASTASGSWWEYVRGMVGYKAPGDDVYNNVNNSDFNIRRADGSGDDFVTPLNPVGESDSIVAVSVISSNQGSAGSLNPVVIHRLPEARQSNSAVVDRLRADYGNLQQWAAGMGVFEIVPTGHDAWLATMGMPRAVQFTALINADSSSCLYSANTGQLIHCSPGAESLQGPGAYPGVDPGLVGQEPGADGGVDGGGGPLPGDGSAILPAIPGIPEGLDLSTLTDAELAALLRSISEESARRITE